MLNALATALCSVLGWHYWFKPNWYLEYCIMGKFGGGKFGILTLFEPLAKESLVN